MTDYSKMFSANDADMLKDAHRAIIACDLWDWFKEYTPDDGKGFMFSNHPNLSRISSEMRIGHSGSSYAWTMRTMQSIAKGALVIQDKTD